MFDFIIYWASLIAVCYIGEKIYLAIHTQPKQPSIWIWISLLNNLQDGFEGKQSWHFARSAIGVGSELFYDVTIGNCLLGRLIISPTETYFQLDSTIRECPEFKALTPDSFEFYALQQLVPMFMKRAADYLKNLHYPWNVLAPTSNINVLAMNNMLRSSNFYFVFNRQTSSDDAIHYAVEIATIQDSFSIGNIHIQNGQTTFIPLKIYSNKYLVGVWQQSVGDLLQKASAILQRLQYPKCKSLNKQAIS